MEKHSKPFQVSPTNPAVAEIQTMPERHADMPYAPAIRVEAPGARVEIDCIAAFPRS